MAICSAAFSFFLVFILKYIEYSHKIHTDIDEEWAEGKSHGIRNKTIALGNWDYH